ncbi:MAG: phosphate ABC transporter ATP-binding protein [Acidimicrobiia bacterium]|nr:phosphate ABC transporter ATP-binding protein [Acidimicrobiia bacterium]
MSSDPLFRFDSVSVAGSSGVRLAEVTFDIPAGGITVLVGPSGSGKSTLLRLCNRLEVPSGGTVRYRGRPLSEFDPLQLRRQVGMVFQRPVLFAGTVRDNLEEADGEAGRSGLENALERAALDRSFLDRPASELSGGEAQRVCLARALVARPEALLMDEPTSSLDGAAVSRLEQLARRLADAGTPVVWVTHDLGQMQRIADRVAVLIGGSLRYLGGPAALASNGDPELTRFLEDADVR